MTDRLLRALGIDYGTVRIGLAISDDLGMMAHPLETLERLTLEEAVGKIVGIVEGRSITDIVVGWPLQMSGEEGAAVARVREFLESLKPKLPSAVMLHQVDERLSTYSAKEKLEAAGKKKKVKGILDQAAAMEILQDWLDMRAQQYFDGGVEDTFPA